MYECNEVSLGIPYDSLEAVAGLGYFFLRVLIFFSTIYSQLLIKTGFSMIFYTMTSQGT